MIIEGNTIRTCEDGTKFMFTTGKVIRSEVLFSGISFGCINWEDKNGKHHREFSVAGETITFLPQDTE